MAQSNRYISKMAPLQILASCVENNFYFFPQKFLNFQFNTVHAEIEFLIETIMSFWPTV